MRIETISLASLQEAVKATKNKSACERALLGTRQKANADAILARIIRENIDISHWTGRYITHLAQQRVPLHDERSTRNSKVRQWVLDAKLLEEVCSECDQGSIWRNQPLKLHLDHRNGNKLDNTLSNLRFLCPNCHQQTPTWGNTKKSKLPSDKVLLEMRKTMQNKEMAKLYGVDASTISHRLRKYNA